MNTKKKFIRQFADARIRRTDLIIKLLILMMSSVVLYDSFVHDLPLYYIIFMAVGVFLGKAFILTHKIRLENGKHDLRLTTNRWSILLVILIILLRFVVGRKILEAFSVLWTTDALFLFFIGVYKSKWKIILKQIDNIYYELISNIQNNN